jgi:putative ABC transport system permease protein
MFLVMIFLLCLLALIIGIPTSQIAAAGLYNQLAELLNLEIRNSSIPFWVILLQIASGVLIPIIAVSFPIIRGSAITVKAALNNYGTNIQKFKSNALLSKLSRLNCVSETIGLSIRNMFRLQSRLLMTLGLLAAGGAMFMSALNVSKAWEVNLEKLYQQRLYDLEIRLNENIIADSIICKIKSIEGIKGVEGWNFTSIYKNKNNSFEISQTYPDKGHGSFTMQALPVPTNILKPNLLAGKWLENNNKNDVVLNQSSKGKHKIGDLVSFKINNLVTDWNVIGFSEDVGSPAIAYVSQGVYSKILNTNGKINMLRISYVDRTKENAILKNQKIETLLEKVNISINATIPIWLLRNAIASHIGVLINALLGMAILMAFIGSIGLMSTMSMNVLERTREIGIMRAIGATPNKIKNLIVWEGLFIGILSILFAFGISLFLSSYLGRLIGNLSFRTPLTLSVSYLGLFIWIIIVITGSYLATLIPTKRTNNISAREALAYE